MTAANTLTPELTKNALSAISVGRRGKSAKVCDGHTLFLYWAALADRKSKDDSGVHLLLRMPLGQTYEWWVKMSALTTKGSSRWPSENLYRLTPEAMSTIAPKLCAFIKRKAGESVSALAATTTSSTTEEEISS